MITPIEIKNKEFRRAFRGYSEEEVEDFLDIVTEDFETLYKENMDLQEKVQLYKEQVSRYKTIEETLNATLITAQSAAEDTCNAANKKAKVIVEEAQLQSKHIIDEANNRILELKKEYDNLVREFKVFRNKFKSLIEDQKDTLEELFYDVDKKCEVPFRDCNYMKEDIEDTVDLFTEEVEIKQIDDIDLSKDDNNDKSEENTIINNN